MSRPPDSDSLPLLPGGLRRRAWKRFLRGPDSTLLEELYVPALAEATHYDRCCAYFSSTILAAAARGFGRLIERLEAMGAAARPAVRLVVNEELSREDVRALTETGDLSRLEELLQRRFSDPTEMLEKERLAMLAWLVSKGWLEVRVGVMRHGEGIVHAKFGIITDGAADAIVFSGSGNESASGLLANYERLEVSTSWEDPERYREYVEEFNALWNDTHADVHTVTLPEAVRLRLVRFAPERAPVAEPSGVVARQKAAMVWRFIAEAPYLPNGETACDATAMVELWPHQRRVVEATAAAWPDGRLLCDEVGMGKTIEAIVVLRRLMAGRGVGRVLLLLPAGLLGQWQAELREKGGLLFPRLEGTATLVWPDDSTEKVSGLAEALQRGALLLSRETARTEGNWPLLMAASPWDLVILDEAHAARRREQEEGEFNRGTLLLDLLRRLQLRRRARSLILLSATPMQTHPWEPWDLLGVLGEGGRWLADFSGVKDFYAAVAAAGAGGCSLEAGRKAAAMIAADPEFPLDGEEPGPPGMERIARKIAFSPPSQRDSLAQWLRLGSPLARRMHRNTRATLRRYHQMGMLGDPPPCRAVDDIQFDYNEVEEREVYNQVGRYIEKRFAELESEKPGKGFVMTIYRRRASSSPLALERSLQRRRDGLIRVADGRAVDPNLIGEDTVDPRDLDDLGDGEVSDRVSAALPADPAVARRELAEVERVLDALRRLYGRDSKRERFYEVLRRVTEDGRAVLVFTEYTDTLEYLRDLLAPHYKGKLACYSGAGGQLWSDGRWNAVGKEAITEALCRGQLGVLLCTDAASEGLNLQAAGAVINYDLPWNPSKVEQRIGRVDRIGQSRPEIRVVNLFLKDSVDDRVYTVLRRRCGLFEHFVGPMQPVLAHARRMLLGRELENIALLEASSRKVQEDPLATETYFESEAERPGAPSPAVTRGQIVEALALPGEQSPLTARDAGGGELWEVSGPAFPRTLFALTARALESDKAAVPFSPLHPRVGELADHLGRPGERLPLVVAAHRSGPFRRSIVYWVGSGGAAAVESMSDLIEQIRNWDGKYPDPARWLDLNRQAQAEARQQVRQMEERAAVVQQKNLQRQIEAARIRLLRELGRYLVCVDADNTTDLNGVLHRQLSRDIASAYRLRQCLDKLGGYPEWDSDLCRELEMFARQLSEHQRKARLLGKELDAALDDPRWGAEV